jgi:hypothetical protein
LGRGAIDPEAAGVVTDAGVPVAITFPARFPTATPFLCLPCQLGIGSCTTFATAFFSVFLIVRQALTNIDRARERTAN